MTEGLKLWKSAPVKNLEPYYPSALVPSKEIPPYPLSWIIRGVGKLNVYRHLTGYRPTENPLYKGGKKAAFTLAEVLITLGIIGVVAAMTLPAIITKYQKSVTVNKVKKFYSEFNQALKNAEVDYGEFKYWSFENNDDIYFKYLKPYLKVVNVQSGVQLSGNFSNGVKIIFSDGTQTICSRSTNLAGYGNQQQLNVCIYFTRGVSTWTSVGGSDRSRFYKNPTREVFWFLIDENGRLIPPHINMNREYNIEQCKENETAGYGVTDCATLLYKDGWEIKDDYPW